MKNATKKAKSSPKCVDPSISGYLSGGFIPDIFVFQPESESSGANPVQKRGAAEWARDKFLMRSIKTRRKRYDACDELADGFIPDIFVS